ncbi:unnamed protein product [Penicillium salamii]|nr:unnamed protein product [Penicillium salamii]
MHVFPGASIEPPIWGPTFRRYKIVSRRVSSSSIGVRSDSPIVAQSADSLLLFSTAYSGSCSLVKSWAISLHLLINLLSTIALATSSYCMQVLVAPPGEQVDLCHARGKWLDIGIPGIRNLTIVGPFRVGLWLILLLTSKPFHLMYVTSDEQLFHLISDNRSYSSAVSRFVKTGDITYSLTYSPLAIIISLALFFCYGGVSSYIWTMQEI